jgi:hypothetical protein
MSGYISEKMLAAHRFLEGEAYPISRIEKKVKLLQAIDKINMVKEIIKEVGLEDVLLKECDKLSDLIFRNVYTRSLPHTPDLREEWVESRDGMEA